MAPPTWVAGVLAAVVLLIAGYCATRLVAARWWRRSTDHGVDVLHAVMGVAMAGMLVPRLSLLQPRAWAVLFAVGAVWFGWQVLRGRRRHRATGPAQPAALAQGGQAGLGGHHGAHVLFCAAMVCMLLAMPNLSVPMTAGRGALPVLALLLAVAVAASVVVSTDRLSALSPAPAPAAVAPAPPRDHPSADGAVSTGGALARPARGSPGRAGAGGPILAPAARGSSGRAGAGGPVLAPAARPALCPRLAACCQIMMGVAMAYMLILML